MAEEGSLLRGCAAGAEAWRAGLGCKDPQSEARERQRQTHLQMHTHILMQHQGARPGAVRVLKGQASGAHVQKGGFGVICPPLSDNTQPGSSSYQALASKKVCIMGLSLLQIQLSSASSRKPSLTISPNWSISCLPCRKPNQGTLKGAEILPSYLPDG